MIRVKYRKLSKGFWFCVYSDIMTQYLFTACSKCPVGTEPVVGFEYKWWNTMPSNMKSDISRRDFGNSGQSTGEKLNTMQTLQMERTISTAGER